MIRIVCLCCIYCSVYCVLTEDAFGAEPKEPYRIFREAADQIMLPREESTPAYIRVGALLRVAKAQRSVEDKTGLEYTLKCAREIADKLDNAADEHGTARYEKTQSLQWIAGFLADKPLDEPQKVVPPNEPQEKSFNMEADPTVIATLSLNRGDYSRSLSGVLHELVQKGKIAEGFLLLRREARNVMAARTSSELPGSFLESAVQKFPPDKLLELAEQTEDAAFREILVGETVLAILRKRFRIHSPGGFVGLSLSRLANVEKVWQENPDVLPDHMKVELYYRHDFDMEPIVSPNKIAKRWNFGGMFTSQNEPEPPLDPTPYIERIVKPFPKAFFVALHAAELLGDADTDAVRKDAARKTLRETYENLRRMDEETLFADSKKRQANGRSPADDRYGSEFRSETAKILVLANALLKAGERELAVDALDWAEPFVGSDNERTWLAASLLRAGERDRYETLREQIVPDTFRSRSTFDEYVTFLETFAALGMLEAVTEELKRFPSEEEVHRATRRKTEKELAEWPSQDDPKWRYAGNWSKARKEWIKARTSVDFLFARKCIASIRNEKFDEAWDNAMQVYSLLTRLTLLEGIAVKREEKNDDEQIVSDLYEKIVKHALELRDGMNDFDKGNLDSNNRNRRFCYVLDFDHPFVRVAVDEKDYREAFDRAAAIWRKADPENDHLVRAAEIAKSDDFDRAIRHAKALGCRDLDLAALGYVAARQYDAGLKEDARRTLKLAESRIGVDSDYKGNSYRYSGNMVYSRPKGFTELIQALLFCGQEDRAVELVVERSESKDSSTARQAEQSMVVIVTWLYRAGRKEKMLDFLRRFQETGRLPEYIWSLLADTARLDARENNAKMNDPVFLEKIEIVFRAAFDEIAKEPDLLKKGDRYSYFGYIYENLGATEKRRNAERLAEEAVDAFQPKNFEEARRKSNALSSLAFYRDDPAEKEELYFRALSQFRLFPIEKTWKYDASILSPVESYAWSLESSRHSQSVAPEADATVKNEPEKKIDLEKKKWSVFWVESSGAFF